MAKINFNGQEYDDPESMPPEVRRLFDMMSGMLADTNQDGVPDILAGVAPTVVQSSQFVVDGQAYQRLNDLPPEARQRIAQALGRLDANGNGIPDMLESLAGGAASAPGAAAPPTPSSTPTPPLVQVIGDPQPLNPATLVLIAVAVLVLLGAVAFYLLAR
jgi:hypothetical protein